MSKEETVGWVKSGTTVTDEDTDARWLLFMRLCVRLRLESAALQGEF
jgi:hypothetical protein